MSPSQFRKAVARGDVTAALTYGPFAYTSQYVNGGFRFQFDSGPMRGQFGIAPTLIDAVRKAMAEPLREEQYALTPAEAQLPDVAAPPSQEPPK